jgi:hypothetical protein
MSAFSCPHFDLAQDRCTRLNTDCVPGRKGCVLADTTTFLVPAEERVRAREAEKLKLGRGEKLPLALLLVACGFATASLRASEPECSLTSVGAKSGINITTDEARGELEVRFDGRRVLLYAHAKTQFKSYVRELITTRGINVLRDAPPDHLHHHGLMYAIASTA